MRPEDKLLKAIAEHEENQAVFEMGEGKVAVVTLEKDGVTPALILDLTDKDGAVDLGTVYLALQGGIWDVQIFGADQDEATVRIGITDDPDATPFILNDHTQKAN